jgi:hypothetical protein
MEGSVAELILGFIDCNLGMEFLACKEKDSTFKNHNIDV